MLRVSNLSKSYSTPQGNVEVLKGLSFDIAAGETVALMGESGCGKSTLLHLIAGLDTINGGTIQINGSKIEELDEAARAHVRRFDVSLVFQQFNLITSLTVQENIGFEAKLAGRFNSDWQASLVDRLGLGELLDRYPEQLSGGQQQRVAIARTFATRPSLILADEPTGNLDEETSDTVIDLAFDLVRETEAAFLMATHSRRLAEKADRVLRLKGGRIE